MEKKVALKLLDGLGVLTSDERAQLERLEGVTAPNLDSFALAGAAQDAQKHGDARAAADLFQRARDTDQGNAQALVGLEKSLAEVEKKNQIAIPSPQSLGEISDAEREMFRRTLTDRLAPLKGLKVIEQSRVKEVDDELDRIMEKDKDNIDPKSIDLQAIGKKLAATVLVRSTMQREGDHVSYSASLIDITDQKLLTGAQVDGPRADEQKLQADLAKQIVQRLRGDPTDEEKLALEATLKADDYQKKMAELTRLLDKEKGEKAAAAAKKKAEDERAALAGAPKQAEPLALADANKLEEAEAAAQKPAAKVSPTVAQRSSTEGGALDVFQLSARGSRVSPAGESGTMLGLVLSHYAKRTPHARYALLLDLESTRLKGRDSSNQTAWYAAGGDFTLPIDFRGTGLFLGASAMIGYSQLQRAAAPSVVSGGLAVSLEPHAGIALAVHGLAVTGDLGYRLPFFLTGSVDNASTGLRGPYIQVGIRTETSPGHDSGGDWVLGYTARALVPNGSTVARKYSTSTIVGGGALLQHAIQISKQSHNTTSGLWVSYGGQSAGAPSSSGDSISRTEASWLYLWHAFSSENFIDPFLGFRIGASYFKGDTLYGNTDAHFGLLGAPMVGVDFQLARAFVLRAGASYDAVLGKSTPSDQDLQGYSLDAGAMLRF